MKNWAIYIAVAIGVVAYNAATEADRDSTGAIISGGNVDAFSIKVGDCFDDTSGDQISQLPAKPCVEPHDNEVYAVFDVNAESFPEGDAMSELAFDSCRQRFQSFVGLDYDSSSLDIMTLYPSRDSWAQQNDREVVCAVYDMEANKLTGSVKGRGI